MIRFYQNFGKTNKTARRKLMTYKIDDRFLQIIVSVVAVIVVLLPTWIYLLARLVISPDSPVTDILLFGVALYFLGGLQIFLGIIGLVFLYAVWNS